MKHNTTDLRATAPVPSSAPVPLSGSCDLVRPPGGGLADSFVGRPLDAIASGHGHGDLRSSLEIRWTPGPTSECKHCSPGPSFTLRSSQSSRAAALRTVSAVASNANAYPGHRTHQCPATSEIPSATFAVRRKPERAM
ncbi:hypothetical protein OH77DRAFT_107879 [Trametes cingulata]|nr:hypothetical protein OH77DRAFT_107879 [Trametes cingulata]